MHGSSWVPWLLIGPITVAVLANMVRWIYRAAWLETLIKGCVVLALAVIAFAFIGAWLGRRRIEKSKSPEDDDAASK